jgi:hypothetical protein
MALLLAPFAGAVAFACECVHGADRGEGAAEFGAIPCCGLSHSCCYEHEEEEQSPRLVAELSRQNRIDSKEDPRPVIRLLPAWVGVVALEFHAIHNAKPLCPHVRERSLRQSWLI